jgi:SSS family solute:Na+ symporter
VIAFRPFLASAVTVTDWGVIVLYALGMVAVGLYYGKRTRGTEDYLLGGRRMKPLAVGLSLFASLLSTISYLGYTGEMIQYGPMYIAGIIVFPLVIFLVGWFMIPRFMELRVTSAYEILEQKLGRSIRLLGAFFFISLRLLWMAVIIFATTDKVLVPLMGLSPSWTPAVCAVMGIVTIVYTSLGGLRAVVFTDVVQSGILFGGALLTVTLITKQLGGIDAWWPQQWPGHWPALQWGYDPEARMTFVGVLLSVFFWHTCTAGSDQIAIQRYFATRDAASARRVLGTNLLVNVLAMALMGVVGLALIGAYTADPSVFDGDGDQVSLTENADQLFPRYIANGLPVGITGLVIAGLLAAAMSSLSSGMSAASSVITAEIFREKRSKALDENAGIRIARWTSLGIGIAVLGLSLVVNQVEGNLFKVTNKVVNLFVSPLFVLFFLAMFVKRSNAAGTWVGAAASVTVAVLIAFWEELTGSNGISFLWIMPAGFVSGVGVGVLASVVFRPRRNQKNEDP